MSSPGGSSDGGWLIPDKSGDLLIQWENNDSAAQYYLSVTGSRTFARHVPRAPGVITQYKIGGMSHNDYLLIRVYSVSSSGVMSATSVDIAVTVVSEKEDAVVSIEYNESTGVMTIDNS